MTHFHAPVGAYQSTPVHTVDAAAPLVAVHALLEERGISAVPVVRDGRPLGVISRTDLLGRGTAHRKGDGRRRVVFDFPALKAEDIMHEGLVTVPTETPVKDAATKMVNGRIHRIFTTKDGVLDGVFSTREAMLSIREARVGTPIHAVMSQKAFTIPADATVEAATKRLGDARAQGLVVVDDSGWPIGLFTQRDALLARGVAETTVLEEVISYGMVCLHVSTPLFRAAAQALDTRARRVLVVESKDVVGVVTGLDFTRVAAHGHG